MTSRSFLLTMLIGLGAHLVVGTIFNLLSIIPMNNSATTGTLGDPLPLFFVFGLLIGLVGLVIDALTGFWRGPGGASAGALTHLLGGFINGLAALVILYLILQRITDNASSTVQGLSQSYNFFLILIAGVGSLMGWLAGTALGAVAGALGALARQRGRSA